MAAIGSKRKRFLGDGNDAMQVTSLVKSPLALPGCDPADYGERYFDRVNPSPASMFSSRLAVQTDTSGERCVAFVATSGGLWRHDVSFAGGTDVREGKEAMLKPTEVTDGRTARVARVAHRSEVQSLAMYDPRGVGDLDGPGDVRVASVDSHGRCTISFVKRDGSDCDVSADDASREGRMIDLRPWRAPIGSSSSSASSSSSSSRSAWFVPGWAGAAFDKTDPDSVAIARHFAKTIDVFDVASDASRPTRTVHTLLCPHSVEWVDRTGAGAAGGAGGNRTRDDKTPGMLAVAEGNQLALYDPRAGERGGCARRMTLCNRGQPLYATACGVSQGNFGGGAVALPNLRLGEPLVAAAGAERCVHVLNADRWSVVKRWPTAIKFEITLLELSAASPDHCYLAGLDYEMVCGCWSRGALAGGFAFRGDSRWLGLARADGVGVGGFNVPGSNPGGGGPGVDIVAGYAESGNLFAARVARIASSEWAGYEKVGRILPASKGSDE